MRRFALIVLGLVCSGTNAHAQREGVHQIGDAVTDLLVRQKTAGRLPADAMVDFLPLSAPEANRLLDTLATRSDELSAADRALVRRLTGAFAPPTDPVARTLRLYRDGVSPYSARGDGYAVEVSPVIYGSAGPARRTERAGQDPAALVYQNTRGVRVGGHLGDHLFFESMALENQRAPAIVEFEPARFTTPRYGFTRLLNGKTYDYFRATGVLGYHDKFVEVRIGRDRNRWGPGINSLLLTDFATPYDHANLRAHAGPFTYAMLLARFTTPERDGSDAVYPSKYAAIHQLGVSLGRVDLELFEAIVFHDDTLNARRTGFEVGYLNPIIFLRPVESDLGSGDNALMGASLAYRPIDGIRTYGQIILDEFTASRLGDDYWGNKWGLLAGIHVVDVGLRGLDVRAEWARLRPYLYGHRSEFGAYVQYSDGLGHVAGPNAQDLSFFATYRPIPKVEMAINAARTHRGRNPDGVNVGADPRVSYITRASSDDVPTFVGVRQIEMLIEARLGYEIWPGLIAEGALVAQSTDDAERGVNRALAGVLQLRWGLPFRSERY